ncbi:MAG: dihydropteroate synthase [Cryobacterium sp.]|jgi:dihydropteroate synthase|nr:dihydropteroate synthase [Cryobacterium sp.]
MTLVMGILNVTPDSFSDGGRWDSTDAAIEHGFVLHAQGADLVDVGGESTRPGARRVCPVDEQSRILPVIRALVDGGVTVSVDTLNAATAGAAAAAGATVINDVSGGLADPAMASVAADTGADYVAMHWRGHAQDMDAMAGYVDVVRDVHEELSARVAVLTAAGVAPERIILDPGLGFAKRAEHNWALLAHLDAFDDFGLRVMVGASRKRFLRDVLEPQATVLERDLPTAVTSVLAGQAKAWAVRVHDVLGTKAALAVLRSVESARMDP